MDEKPKSGYDRYCELIEKKESRSDLNIVPKAIGIMGAICLLGGVLALLGKLCSPIEALAIIAGSFFLFGFSIIVKAACKYLDKQ